VAHPVGGQPFAMYHLSKQKHLPEGVAISTPVLNYTIGRFASLFISIIAIIFLAVNLFGSNEFLPTWVLVTAIIGIVVNLAITVFVLLSFVSVKASKKLTSIGTRMMKFLKLTKDHEKLYDKVIKKLDATRDCIKNIGKSAHLWICVMWSIAFNLALSSIGYFVLKSFGFYTTHGWGWAEVVMLSLLIARTMSIIPIPGKAGAVEMTNYGVFSLLLASAPGIAAGAMSVLTLRVISFYIPLLFTFICVLIIARLGYKRIDIAGN